MAVPQPGIFAQGTRSHYHLEFDLRPDASAEAVRAALGGLREPPVTVGGSNLVVGFGADLARRLIPADVPPDAQVFPGVSGPAGDVPSTPHDIWVWSHGTGEDVSLDIARAIHACLAPVATLARRAARFRVPGQSRPHGFHRRHREPAGRAGARGGDRGRRPGGRGIARDRRPLRAQPGGVPRAGPRRATGHDRPDQAGQRRARPPARHLAHRAGADRGGRRRAGDLPPVGAVRAGRRDGAVLHRVQRRSQPLPEDARPRCTEPPTTVSTTASWTSPPR